MSDKQYRDPDEVRREQGIDAPMDKKSKVERLKAGSDGLRGNVREEMLDPEAPAVSNDSYQLMKHFGMYQQDDRDTRKERRRAGLDKDYSFMVRTKVPGGLLTADQYLTLDDIAVRHSKGSLRLTTRQTIQFHGVGKEKLCSLVRDLNRELMNSYGACGDVVRNTMSCPVIDIDPDPRWAGRGVFRELTRQISDRYLPRSTAFYDVFIDGERQDELGSKIKLRDEREDIYGETYMPRKFKIGVTIPEDNCVDIFSQDLGLVALIEDGEVQGYNVLAGGGLGFTHGKEDTYPRLATPVAFASTRDVLYAVEAVVTIQRDYGNRVNRKRARLKYVLDELGPQWFHEEMVRRTGGRVEPARPIAPERWEMPDHLGWHEQKQSGLFYAGIFIENGRIVDKPGDPMRANLRKIVERFRPQVRITPQQNLILCNVSAKHRREMDAMLRDSGFSTKVKRGGLSELRRHEMACVALPTCGLALSESERVMPGIIGRLEEMGFGKERVSIRISGCPNSCSRPNMSEIGIIGRAPNKFNLYVGGDFEGTRLNQLLHENIVTEDLAPRIGGLLRRWKQERREGEAFGDWSLRAGVDALREVPPIGTRG